MDFSNLSPYGSKEYYSELFSDILADVATGDIKRDEQTIVNVLAGFESAIISWLEYYDESQRRFRDIHGRFMRGDFSES